MRGQTPSPPSRASQRRRRAARRARETGGEELPVAAVAEISSLRAAPIPANEPAITITLPKRCQLERNNHICGGGWWWVGGVGGGGQ